MKESPAGPHENSRSLYRFLRTDHGRPMRPSTWISGWRLNWPFARCLQPATTSSLPASPTSWSFFRTCVLRTKICTTCGGVARSRSPSFGGCILAGNDAAAPTAGIGLLESRRRLQQELARLPDCFRAIHPSPTPYAIGFSERRDLENTQAEIVRGT